MAKYSNTIEYNIKTNIDDSGVSKLQLEIRQLEYELEKLASTEFISKKQSSDAINELNKVRKALAESFNANLGMLDTSKFASIIKKNNMTIASMGQAFSAAGIKGDIAFNNLIGRLGKLDTGFKSISSTTDKIANTIGNTVRWGIIASGFQTIMNSAHRAVEYMQDLDRSLNDIRIVSDYTAEDMREFALYANEAAQALGQTTVAYTDASLIFAQQGFNLQDSNELAEMVLKVANTTGQATEEVSEQITSWMNGYQMSIDQVGVTLDKVTKVAAVGAADTEELMTAASKVASTAHMLGVTEDQLITQMSTIISVTREAPENVGNALKTIYARLGDLKMGETLEDGTDLGNLSGTLEKVGIQILDDTGAMRNMGDVLEELMAKWNTFDRGQQQALAVKLAGKYQYSRFSALMQNSEMYNEQLAESMNSEGFLERTQDIYMESLAAKFAALQASFEGFITEIFDPDDFKPFLDSLTDALSLMTDLVESIGGGKTALTAFGAVATKVLSTQISRGINNMIQNYETNRTRKNSAEAAAQLLSAKGLDATDTKNKDILSFASDSLSKQKILSTQQQEESNKLLDEAITLQNQEYEIQKKIQGTVIATNMAYNLNEQKGIQSEINTELEEQRNTAEKIRMTQAEILALTNKEKTQSDKITAREQKLTELKEQSKELQKTIPQLENVEAKQKQYNAALERQEKTSERILKLEEELTALRNERTATSTAITEKNADINTLRSEALQRKKEIQELQNQKDNFDSEAKLQLGYTKKGFIDTAELRSNIEAVGVKDFALTQQQLQELDFNVTATNLGKLQQAIVKVENEFYNAKNAGDVSAKKLIEAFKNVLDEQSLVGKEAQRLREIFKTINPDGLKNTTIQVDKLGKELEEARVLAGNLKEIFENPGRYVAIGENIEEFIDARTLEQRANEEAQQSSKEKREGFTSNTDRQQTIKSVTEVTSAIGQLVVASQSLSNIQAIFNDDTLLNSEKFAQILQNLAFTAPMAVMSFMQLDSALGNTKTIKTYRAELENVKKSGVTGLAAVSTAARNTNVAFGKSTSGIKVFGTALRGLSTSIPGLLLITAIIGGISTAFSLAEQNAQKLKESQQDAVATAKENLESSQSTIENFNNLYEEYKKTGKVTDEFKEASIEVSKQLKIQNGEVLTLTGQYDALAKSVDSATKSQRESLLEASKAERNGWIANSLNGQGLFNLDATSDIRAQALGVSNTWNIGEDILLAYKAFFAKDELREAAITVNQINKSSSFAETLGIIRTRIKTLNEEIEELEKQGVESTDERIKLKQEQIANLQQSLKQEDILAYYENLEAVTPYYFEAFFEKQENQKLQGQELIDALLKDKNILEILQAASSDWLEQLAILIENTTDQAQKTSLQIIYSKSILEQKAKSVLGDDKGQEAIEKVLNAGFTDEQLIAFVATLDEDKSFYNIDKAIRDFEHTDAAKIKLEPEIAGIKNAVENAVKAIAKDEPIAKEDWQKILGDDLYERFEKLGGQSEYLNNVFDLLTQSTYDFQMAIIDLDKNLEKVDYETNIREINRLRKEYNELAAEYEKMDVYLSSGGADVKGVLDTVYNANPQISGEVRLVKDLGNAASKAHPELETLSASQESLSKRAQNVSAELQAEIDIMEEWLNVADDMEQQSLSLLINIVGDAMDRAAAQIEALDDVGNAVGAIGEGFTVAADDVENLANAIPGILEGATQGQEGLVQLNEEVARSAIASAESQAKANMQAAIDELEAKKQVLLAVADLYYKQADFLEEQLANGVYTQKKADSLILESKNTLNTKTMEIMGGLDDLNFETADNQSDYFQQAGQNMADSINEGATLANKSLLELQNNSVTFANTMIRAYHEVGAAIAGAAEGRSDTGQEINILPQQSISGKESVSSNEIENRDLTVPWDTPLLANLISGETPESIRKQIQEVADGYRSIGDLALSLSEDTGNRQAAINAKMNQISYDFSQVGKSKDKAKKSTADYLEMLEKEIDLYQDVNAHLNKLSAQYDILSKARSRLTGKELTKNMKEEINLLSQQVSWQKEKLYIQEKVDAAQKKAQLANYGIQFNPEGYATNYAQVWQNLYFAANNAAAQYNASQSEYDKNMAEWHKNRFEEFEEIMGEYDDLQTEMVETEAAIKDLEDAMEDARIEAFRTVLETKKNIQELRESLIDFEDTLSGNIFKDDPFKNAAVSAKKIAGYFDIGTEASNKYFDNIIARTEEQLKDKNISEGQRKWLEQRLAGYKDARIIAQDDIINGNGTGYLDMNFADMDKMIEQIKWYESIGRSEIFGEDAADMYETANQVYEDALNAYETLRSEIVNLHGYILDMIEDVNNRIEDRREQYDRITDSLEHQANIIKMLRGEENLAYEELSAVRDAKNQRYKEEIQDIVQYNAQGELSGGYLKELQILRDELEVGSEEWEKVNDMIIDTQNRLNDLVEESLRNMQEQYEATVNKQLNQWIKSALGTDIDWMQDQWELINRNADYYLDEVNAAYNIQKLQGKYTDLLNDANGLGLSIQQKITNQMSEQLAYLREKDKLSEYDVAYAEAQLEILQKQIALEEARRNKSQMKLKRDSQGNYSYVYTADEGDVSQAEQDLLDAQNNAYNLSKDQIRQTQEDSLSALADARNMLANIWTDANLDIAEKEKRTEYIINMLNEYLAGTSEQLSTSEKNIINDFLGMVDMLTEENARGLLGIADDLQKGIDKNFMQIDMRWATSLTEWLHHMDDFSISTNNMFENLVDNANDYQTEIDNIAKLVGDSFNDMTDNIQQAVDATDSLADSRANFMEQLKQDAGTIAADENTLQYYISKITDAENAMNGYVQRIKELEALLEAKEQEDRVSQMEAATWQGIGSGIPGGGGNSSSGSGSGGGNSGGNGTQWSNEELADGIAGAIWVWKDNGWGNDPTRSNKLINAFGSAIASRAQQIINNDKQYGVPGNQWDYYRQFTSYNLIGYDTGGYTGTWNDKTFDINNGKLALLHQKELVLNETDTLNLLKAVEAIRDAANNTKQNVFDNLTLQTNDIMETIYDKMYDLEDAILASGNLHQEVIINADFPNVRDSNEIYEALLTMQDMAQQYAYRNEAAKYANSIQATKTALETQTRNVMSHNIGYGIY